MRRVAASAGDCGEARWGVMPDCLMPEKFSVSVDFGITIPPHAAFDRATFPNLSNAVARIAQEAHARWTAYAAGAPLPNGQVINDRTGTYLKSIQMTMTGDFSALVYSNLPYAAAIESGSPARDMKTMLNSSFKVRVAKDGSRYLIIPVCLRANDRCWPSVIFFGISTLRTQPRGLPLPRKGCLLCPRRCAVAFGAP